MGVIQKKSFNATDKQQKNRKFNKDSSKAGNVQTNGGAKKPKSVESEKNASLKHKKIQLPESNKESLDIKAQLKKTNVAQKIKKNKVQNVKNQIKPVEVQNKKLTSFEIENKVAQAKIAADGIKKEQANSKNVKEEYETEDTQNKAKEVDLSKFDIIPELIPKSKVKFFVDNFLKLHKFNIDKVKSEKSKESLNLSSFQYRLDVTATKIPQCSKHHVRM